MLDPLSISLFSLVIAVISAAVAFLSYRDSAKNYRLNQTPILLPDFQVSGEQLSAGLLNRHQTGTAKNVNLSLRNGKLDRIYSSTENEFLPPTMAIRRFDIPKDIDGCDFTVTYCNLFNNSVFITGRIHEIKGGVFDIQHVSISIDTITPTFLSNILP